MSGNSGGTTVIQPTPPPQPSTADAINAYVASLPQMFAAQLQYAPQEAAQQVALAQQYAQPLAQAYKTAQETLYPGTSGLQEQLASQAQQGMNAQVPDWMRQQYQSDMNAQLGTQAGSPIGGDYVSRGLLQQQQGYQQYYQNLGLSLAGRQPLVSPQTPGYTSQLAQYNPGQVMGFMGGNYGTYAGASRPMLGQSGTPNWAMGLNAAGNFMQGVGGMGTAMALCWVAAELFDGWDKPKTHYCRYFIKNISPTWFRNFYRNNGVHIAEYISDKPILKILLRPLFEIFSFIGLHSLQSRLAY